MRKEARVAPKELYLGSFHFWFTVCPVCESFYFYGPPLVVFPFTSCPTRLLPGQDWTGWSSIFFHLFSTAAPVRVQMPMKSVPMMRAYDPDSDHEPIAPKVVSASNFLGSKDNPNKGSFCEYCPGRQRRRPLSVWRRRWRTSCRYVRCRAHPTRAHMADIPVDIHPQLACPETADERDRGREESSSFDSDNRLLQHFIQDDLMIVIFFPVPSERL